MDESGKGAARFDTEAVNSRPLKMGNNGTVVHELGRLIAPGIILCIGCMDVWSGLDHAKIAIERSSVDDTIHTDNVSHTDKCAACGLRLDGK